MACPSTYVGITLIVILVLLLAGFLVIRAIESVFPFNVEPPPTVPPGNLDDPCSTTRPCNQPYVCTYSQGPTGVCKIPTGGACSFDGECQPDHVCYQNTCQRQVIRQLNQTCTSSLEDGPPVGLVCNVGLTCQDQVCKTRQSYPCQQTTDCAEGLLCQDGVCIPDNSCVIDQDCPVGYVCSMGQCRVMDGGPCLVHQDCQVNSACVNGICQPKGQAGSYCFNNDMCMTGLTCAKPGLLINQRVASNFQQALTDVFFLTNQDIFVVGLAQAGLQPVYRGYLIGNSFQITEQHYFQTPNLVQIEQVLVVEGFSILGIGSDGQLYQTTYPNQGYIWTWQLADQEVSADLTIKGDPSTIFNGNLVHGDVLPGYLWLQTETTGYLYRVESNLVLESQLNLTNLRFYGSDLDHYADLDLQTNRAVIQPGNHQHSYVRWLDISTNNHLFLLNTTQPLSQRRIIVGPDETIFTLLESVCQ